MSTITGRVIFNPTSSASIDDSENRNIPNVSVTLINEEGSGLVIATDSNGVFTFINVPAGTYQLVETADLEPTTVNPGDFLSIGVVENVDGTDPTVSQVGEVPEGTNEIVSLSPNLINLNVSTADITDLYFLDSPRRLIYLPLNQYATVGENLITTISNGTFGSYPAGTSVGTSPATEPYESSNQGFNTDFYTVFSYVQYDNRPYYEIPQEGNVNDGDYSIVNITTNNAFRSYGGWWNLSVGDERNRLAVVNGNYVNQPIFLTTVGGLEASTYYIFYTWFSNIDISSDDERPRLRVRIENSNGEIIFNEDLSDEFPASNIPTWHQVGTVFRTSDDTTADTRYLLAFLSEGDAASGNDFACEAIVLQRLQTAAVTDLDKRVSDIFARPGDVLTYNLSFTNTSAFTITDVSLEENISPYVTVNRDSLEINNVLSPDSWEGNNVIRLPDVLPGDTAAISFTVTVNDNLEGNTIINNNATLVYSYTLDGTTNTNRIISNTVQTLVFECNCPTGPTGPTGANGIAGPTGATGPAGLNGVTGPAGIAGPIGATGTPGMMGPRGATGPVGVTGLAGPTGATGPAGATGIAGATGATGVVGPTGATGPRGESVKIGPLEIQEIIQILALFGFLTIDELATFEYLTLEELEKFNYITNEEVSNNNYVSFSQLEQFVNNNYVSFQQLEQFNFISYEEIEKVNKRVFAQYKLYQSFSSSNQLITIQFIKSMGDKENLNVRNRLFIQLNIPGIYYVSYSINLVINSPRYKLKSCLLQNSEVIKASFFEFSNVTKYCEGITMTGECIVIAKTSKDVLSLIIKNYSGSKVVITSGKISIISI